LLEKNYVVLPFVYICMQMRLIILYKYNKDIQHVVFIIAHLQNNNIIE
jgi:hypothetical protein